MSFNLFDVVGRLVTATLSVTRRGADTFDAGGRPVHGATTLIGITAVHYPSSPKELLRLPEGERTGARLTIFTTDIIRVGDVVDADNAKWQVDSLEYTAATNTYKALAKQVGP